MIWIKVECCFFLIRWGVSAICEDINREGLALNLASNFGLIFGLFDFDFNSLVLLLLMGEKLYNFFCFHK